MTADWLLSTKLHLPAPRPGAVSRPRLMVGLDQGLRLGRRLTLVSAPAGFGKTTLIREWSETVDRPAAWLLLDDGDNDSVRFARYLWASLAQLAEPVRHSAADLPAEAPARPLATRLINALSKTEAGLLLVLDDYHAIRDPAVHDLVAFLLANQPPCLHLAVLTREDPPLPLARLRAADQITEVRERSLRFTPAEAAEFLNRTMSLGLSAASVALLAVRTEGWIAGLQLAGLALRQSSTPDEFVAAFAGDDRFIVDYLMAEVLGREPEAVRCFLRQTSILDRLSAPLCAAITGREDCQTVLDRLEAANLFLLGLDNRREWYRYHTLFAEVLRLSLSGPERATLHDKAAAWFQAQGQADLAEQHRRQGTQTSVGSVSLQPRPPAADPLVEPLSDREIEVLRLIANGLSNNEISVRLFIAPGTVKRHLNNIYGKLQVGSRTQAVAVAQRLRLL